MRLGILTSHPIQYQAPWFRALAREMDLQVYFAHRPAAAEQGTGFGKAFTWDVDLLSGYPHQFLKNIAPAPDVSRPGGCDTPEIEGIIRGQRSEVGGQRSVDSGQKAFDAFIVTGWYLKSYRQAIRACRRAGVPVLVRGDSQLGTPRSFLRKLAMELRQRWLLRQFDGFLSVGQRHTEYLRHFGVPAEKITFAPHFVDNEWFAGRAAESRNRRSHIRKQWRIPENAFVPLFVGKFQPKKRPMDLVEAARQLLSSPPRTGRGVGEVSTSSPLGALLPASCHTLHASTFLHLLFVGSGELGGQLRETCDVIFDAETPSLSASHGERAGERCDPQPSTLNLQPVARPRATFAGFKNQSELPAIYAAADVLVLPSDGGETWGLVVNEAMACGLPAIVSDAAGCAPDLIEDGRTGFTFPMGDVEALVDRLAHVREMHMRRHDWGDALRAKMAIYDLGTATCKTFAAISKFGFH
jgi:glycosyltransferase involved in cell wall biosynthesis